MSSRRPCLDDDGNPTTFYSRYHVGAGAGVQDYREPLGTAWALRYFHLPNAGDAANTSIRAWKSSTNQALVQDLSNGSYTVDPAELYSNSCTPYTYYAWDEDENVIGVSGGFIPPWSGEDPQPLPQPNLFPLETQEVPARQFYLVGDTDAAFGWMLFIWPRSNTVDPGGAGGRTVGSVPDLDGCQVPGLRDLLGGLWRRSDRQLELRSVCWISAVPDLESFLQRVS